ncbi:hypothetical protein P9F85_05425 [Bacillus stercoris]|uniref:hypothetical protein n=1 Tax=Bacillus stercoris TaxID=2054641 RepID=UPI002DBFEC7A|nr:hypothetical protein [Bacillus stercoris]MEC2110704.1 hypothetical protein [Bacillus stercoris]
MNFLDNQYTYCSKLMYQVYGFSTSGVFPLNEGSRFWEPYHSLQGSAYPSVTPGLVYKKDMVGKGDIQ